MEDTKNTQKSLLAQVAKGFASLSDEDRLNKYNTIEQKLFEFANFIESQAILLYAPLPYDIIPTEQIITKTLSIEKNVILPLVADPRKPFLLYKITDYKKDMSINSDGLPVPASKCKKMSLEEVDIAIIPGLVFDDKGGRVGFGNQYYNKLITKLPETCRKISLAYEEQMVDQIVMASRKYTVDIIITDQRTIYKI